MFWTSPINQAACDVARGSIFLWVCLLCAIPVRAQVMENTSKRSDIHQMIDRKQLEIDTYDGTADGRVDLGRDRETNMATTAYITIINLLQTTVDQSQATDLEKFNDLVGIFNLIAELNERNIGFVGYHHENIYNAYGILSHKALGSLDRFLYRHMLPSLNNITLYKDEGITSAFLHDAAYQYPAELLRSFAAFQKEEYARDVLEHTARVAPNSIKQYFPTKSYINNYLLTSKDPTVNLITSIYKQYGAESKAYFFLDKVAANPARKGYYSYLQPETETYLRELIDIRKKESPLGAYSLDQELQIQALRYVRVINDMHLMKESSQRFASVDSMDVEELYTLIVYSAEEIFTSTYNGIFSRMISRMQTDSINGLEFLETMNFHRFRTFIKLAAGYNTLNTFLTTLPPSDQEKLFAIFVDGLGKNLSDLAEAVNVADTFGSLEDSTQLREFLDHLALAYAEQRRQENLYGEVIYSLLISLIAEKIDLPESMAGDIELLELPPLDHLEVATLLGRDNHNIQQHFFFDDDDGLLSYGTFLNTYRNSHWAIEEHEHYVIIRSRDGNLVEIYANKPLSEREGQKKIRDLFEQKSITPSIVVHRGHSYYVHLTIDQVQPDVKMVFLGSCGGYHNLSQVIDRSPKVHIISSKQIGTILVNNPLLYAISESIRKGEDLYWAGIWDTVGKQLQYKEKAIEKFQDYIPPHKNLGAIFLQAYYELTG